MKHLIKIFLFTMVLTLFPTVVTAKTLSPICGTLSKVDPKYKDIPSKGQRTPSMPIAYTITEEGGLQIMSSSISTEDIIEFEICDIESNDCIYSFSDEQTFIETLFTLSGEYQIRLITSDCELIGDITL